MIKKTMSVCLGTILTLGVIGLGVSLISNRHEVNQQLVSDIDYKNSTEYNYVLQQKITIVKQEINNLVQKRKVNSDMDKSDLQNSITQTKEKSEDVINYLQKLTVTEKQNVAKENTIAALNELNYSLDKLKEEVTKESFKTQGNETVDTLYTNINNSNLKIDDYIDLWE